MEPLSHQSIVELLESHYGIHVTQLSRVPGGADLSSATYKAEAPNASYFVKLRKGSEHAVGLKILELLRNSGNPHVIAPIRTKQGELTKKINDLSIILFPFINAKNGFDQELTRPQWIKLGQALKHVHQMDLPPTHQGLIRREAYSSRWRDTVRSQDARMEAGNQNNDELGLSTYRFLTDHRSVIFKLVDQSEKLSLTVKKIAPSLVLCHSDIHAGNVLIDETGGIFIVDWDDPILAPKERDLMFMGGGVGGVWNRKDEEKAFYEGYGRTIVDPTILAYYRRERIIEDIAIYANELLLERSGTSDKDLLFKYLTQMFEPHNVVEIALST